LIVNINISSQSLKITAGSPALIEKWSTLQVTDGLIKDGLILNPEAIGRQIKDYFDNERLSRQNVNVSLTGASYVYRLIRLPHLPDQRLREAIERATQKEIHLDLADLYIDWDILGEHDGEMEIFVTGMTRRAVESILQALNIADIKPQRIELASLALARAADRSDTLLVNFEPDCFDIAIISAGIPVTLHNILTKSRESNLQDQVMQLTDELTRAIDFYNLSHKEHLIQPGASLVLSGSLATEPSAAESLQAALGLTVSIIKPAIAYPPDFPASAYSINLGLALKKNSVPVTGPASGQAYRDIDINLMRGRKRSLARPISFNQLLVPAVLTLAAILLTPALIKFNDSKIQSALLKSELVTVIHQVNQRQMELEQDAQLQKTIEDLNQDTQKTQREIEVVTGKGDLYSMLQILIDCLPLNSAFNDIDCSSKLITIDGYSEDRADVISYARTLEKTQQFTSVRIALIDESGDDPATPGTRFRLIIER